MTTGAVVLAAGQSTRMGSPKMLLPWEGGTVLTHVTRTLLRSPVEQVAVVLGHRAGEVAAALGPLAAHPRVRVCVNDRHAEGMLTSIQCGVRGLLDGCHVLVALGDQPLVTAAAVQQVLAAHAGGLTVPVYGECRGHPVCVDASLRAELLALPPEAGLRGLFQAHPERVTMVDVACEGVLQDLDTPADYARFRPAALGR